MVVIHVLPEDASQAEESQDEDEQYYDDDNDGGHFGLDFVVLEEYLYGFEVDADAFEGLSFFVHFTLRGVSDDDNIFL